MGNCNGRDDPRGADTADAAGGDTGGDSGGDSSGKGGGGVYSRSSAPKKRARDGTRSVRNAWAGWIDAQSTALAVLQARGDMAGATAAAAAVDAVLQRRDSAIEALQHLRSDRKWRTVTTLHATRYVADGHWHFRVDAVDDSTGKPVAAAECCAVLNGPVSVTASPPAGHDF